MTKLIAMLDIWLYMVKLGTMGEKSSVEHDIPLLLLSPRYTDDSNNLWRAAIEQDWHVHRITGKYGNDIPEHELAEINRHSKVVIYGDPLFYDIIKDQVKIDIIQPNDSWLTELPITYLNRRVAYIPLWIARQLQDKTFVKPPDEKVFEAKVYEAGELREATKGMASNFMCLVSKPVVFSEEYRMFTRNRSVVDHSSYMIDGKINIGEKSEVAVIFAEHLLHNMDIEVPLSMTLDVGVTMGEHWMVVEANACWASGLYGCDPKEVLRSLSMASVRLPHNINERWIR